MAEQDSDFIVLGRVAGAHGVRGWIKLRSDTDPMDNILTYNPWYLRDGRSWRRHELADGRVQGKSLVAHLEGIDDRDAALALRGVEIAVKRDQLPPPEAGEYYWVDLIGLRVVNTGGEDLGRVERLMETGANDVLVVVAGAEQELLIPFVQGVHVRSVDLEAGVITVDWERDY